MCYVTNRTTHTVNSARSMTPSGKTPLHKVWSISIFAVCMCVFYVPQHRVDHTSLYCMYSIQVHVTQLNIVNWWNMYRVSFRGAGEGICHPPPLIWPHPLDMVRTDLHVESLRHNIHIVTNHTSMYIHTLYIHNLHVYICTHTSMPMNSIPTIYSKYFHSIAKEC